MLILDQREGYLVPGSVSLHATTNLSTWLYVSTTHTTESNNRDRRAHVIQTVLLSNYCPESRVRY